MTHQFFRYVLFSLTIIRPISLGDATFLQKRESITGASDCKMKLVKAAKLIVELDRKLNEIPPDTPDTTIQCQELSLAQIDNMPYDDSRESSTDFKQLVSTIRSFAKPTPKLTESTLDPLTISEIKHLVTAVVEIIKTKTNPKQLTYTVDGEHYIVNQNTRMMDFLVAINSWIKSPESIESLKNGILQKFFGVLMTNGLKETDISSIFNAVGTSIIQDTIKFITNRMRPFEPEKLQIPTVQEKVQVIEKKSKEEMKNMSSKPKHTDKDTMSEKEALKSENKSAPVMSVEKDARNGNQKDLVSSVITQLQNVLQKVHGLIGTTVGAWDLYLELFQSLQSMQMYQSSLQLPGSHLASPISYGEPLIEKATKLMATANSFLSSVRT
jgi:hypothetical protein